MNKNIIILGPPGSGKGTQAKCLAEKLNLTYFGTGDLIREEIAAKTARGEEFNSFLKKGELIPDDLLDQLIREKIGHYKNGPMVFDGFPRTMDQVKIMEDVWAGDDFLVLNIQVKSESLINRMEKRRICSGCGKIFIIESDGEKVCDVCGGQLIRRSDDNPEVLKNRIKVYEAQTAPIIDYYKEKNNIIDIDGEPSIEEVENDIWEKVNAAN